MRKLGFPIVEAAGLDDKAARFIAEFMATGNMLRAETASGVSRGYGSVIMRRPAVQAAVHAELRRHLVVGAPLALATLITLCERSESERVRVDAAKAILDRAGFVAPKAQDPGKTADKALNEMSLDDLRDLAARLEEEIAGRARDVTAPATEPAPPQASDLID